MSITQPFANSRDDYDPNTLPDTLGGLPSVIPEIGFLLLQPPSTIEEAVENGITVIVLADEGCDHNENKPHDHDRTPLSFGRISYAKAHNLALHLLEICATVQPLNVSEKAVVVRINEKINTLIAERDAVATRTEHTGPFSVI